MNKNPQRKREIEQSENLHSTLKLISSLLPGGSSVYELFAAIVVPLHEKRREEWIRELTLRLHKLEREERVNLKTLKDNDEFITIITKATLLVQQTHQKEKIEALHNVVINSALYLNGSTSLFDWAVHFLNIIDRISPLHILLLKTFRNLADEVELKNIKFTEPLYNNDQVFFMLYPELKDRSSLVNQCWKELAGYGFVVDELFRVDGPGKATLHSKEKILSKTTDFGNKFLDMILAGREAKSK